MNKNFSLLFLVIIALLSGCQRQPKTEVVNITEEQAKLIVEQYHEKNNNHSMVGSIQITSVKHINNQYEVRWERKINCENGIDHVSDQDGSMGDSVVSIC
ncbi:hypothetical protein [Paenibacillus xylanilyticus]|uniref:hypothetical protein n=1 Tax=Paenibacillus xylanilyticus TaxID=248903 RepID=UPI003AAE66D6